MVSAGIIGTFWGTFIALADFQTGAEGSGLDHQAMVNSIPKVLAGMKSAFITSLIGLFSAFVAKITLHHLPKNDPAPLPIEEETTELLREIKDGIVGEGDKSLSSQIARLQTEYRDGAAEIKQSIAGDSDSSITSQLVKLRNENSDGFKKMDARLAELTDEVYRSLVKSLDGLTNELREVIADQLVAQLKKTNEVLREQLREMLNKIEEALIRQFGETFKQFNEATQAIKKWQEEHRAHVEQLTAAFQTAAAGITQIRTECESIPATMEQLRALMGELDERLRAFAEMKKSAEESFPVIKANLDSIGADLQKSAEGFTGLENTITAAYEKASALAQRHIEMSQTHIENVGTQITRTAEKLTETAEEMITESRNAAEQHQTAIKTTADEMQTAMRESVAQTQNAISALAETIQKQATDSAAEIKTAAENWIDESRNAANQQREDIRGIVDEAQKASQKCVENTQTALTQMTEQNAQATTDALTAIVNNWGRQIVGVAEQLAKIIQNPRQ